MAVTVIKKSAIAAIRDQKMLMVRTHKNQTVLYTLGGKLEEGETAEQALHREVREEAGTAIMPESLVYFGEFSGAAHGRPSAVVSIDLYLGELEGEPVPSNEIAEIHYVDSSVDRSRITPVAIDMLAALKRAGHIA